MAGIEVLANMIETIWSDRFIRRPSNGFRFVMLIVLGGMVGLLVKKLWPGIVIVGMLAILYYLCVSIIFDQTGLMLDLLYPLLTVLLSLFVVVFLQRPKAKI